MCGTGRSPVPQRLRANSVTLEHADLSWLPCRSRQQHMRDRFLRRATQDTVSESATGNEPWFDPCHATGPNKTWAARLRSSSRSCNRTVETGTGTGESRMNGDGFHGLLQTADFRRPLDQTSTAANPASEMRTKEVFQKGSRNCDSKSRSSSKGAFSAT